MGKVARSKSSQQNGSADLRPHNDSHRISQILDASEKIGASCEDLCGRIRIVYFNSSAKR